MLPAGVHVPDFGSYVALAAVGWPTLGVPPAATTCPDKRSVAVWPSTGVLSDPVGDQVSDAEARAVHVTIPTASIIVGTLPKAIIVTHYGSKPEFTQYTRPEFRMSSQGIGAPIDSEAAVLPGAGVVA